MLALVAASLPGLVVPTPIVAQPFVVPSTPAVQQFVVSAPAATRVASGLLFPTTDLLAGTAVSSFDDELDKIAAVQMEQDAKIEARKAEIRARQEEAEAKASAEYQAKVKQDAERKAKTEAAIAKQKAESAARAAAIAEERAAKEAAKGVPAGKSAAKSDTAKKFSTVEKVSSRAERIEARKAAGGEAPSLFGS